MDFDADPWDYLGASEAIDLEHPLIQAKASELRTGDDIAYAHGAFDFVRDEITASPSPTRASEILHEGKGQRAHLLVALLRAGGIQAGFCHQNQHPLTVALVDDRWVRLDPQPGVEFSPSEDRLADQTTPPTPTVHATPAR